MSYTDKTLQCVECGKSFAFSAQEQETFANRGYTNDPKRCLECRETRRTSRSREDTGGGQSSGQYAPRQMFDAVCATCGAKTQLPFQPRQGRPVYCNTCFAKVRTTPTTRT